jgi:hypothetical protein
MVGLRPHDYCCALSGLPFWSGDGGTYGPTIPTLGRLNNDRDCSDENIRIVCLDFNSLRGRGSDDQMYRMAKALVRHRGGGTVTPTVRNSVCRVDPRATSGRRVRVNPLTGLRLW